MRTSFFPRFLTFSAAFLAVLLFTGGCGGDSDDGPSTPSGLSVSITLPLAGSTVTGTAVGVRATVSGDRPASSSWPTQARNSAASVSFYIDDALIGTRTDSPYFLEWDSSTVPNGQKTLKAVATNDGETAEDTVTLVVNNEGIPADELELLVGTYSAGFNLDSTVREANQFVFQAILFASCTTGEVTVTGSVTENPPGSGQFQYTNTPTDRLQVTINSQTIDVVVASLQIDESSVDCEDWRSLERVHVIEYSVNGPNVALAIGSARTPEDSITNNINRLVQGAATIDGRTWQVNGQVEGRESFFVDTSSGFTLTEDRYTFSGTFTSDNISVTVAQDQSYDFQSSSGSSFTEQVDSVRSQGTNGNVSFSFSELSYSWTDTNSREPIYQGTGTILRNGTAFGSFVVESASGASGIQLLDGTIVPF